jgi:hypothetical protein
MIVNFDLGCGEKLEATAWLMNEVHCNPCRLS